MQPIMRPTIAWLVPAAVVLGLAPSRSAAQGEVLIPRSMAGDRGSYYLLEAKRVGDVVRTLHKRVGPSGTGYTRLEVNCRTMLMREIGYSEESPAAIRENPTKWFEIVPGSSKSDLANFVCTRRR